MGRQFNRGDAVVAICSPVDAHLLVGGRHVIGRMLLSMDKRFVIPKSISD